MGSGIASWRRLPRQRSDDKNARDDAGTPVGNQARSPSSSGHPADLISPQPLSYEERRDRWLRDNGALWSPDPENAERERI